MNILQRIFTDYYEKIKYTLHPRFSEMENIEKMINCGDPSFGGAISKEKHHVFRCFNQWRTAILSSFGYDPLQCPDCGHEMEFLELYYNHQRVSLEELYKKAMSKSRGKRSSS